MISLININNAEKIGFNSKFELFDSAIAFKRVSEFQLSVVFSDITSPDGEIISLTDLETLKNTTDYNYFNVNGITIPRAKLTNFSVPSGNFNKSSVITITLQIQDIADDLDTSQGAYYRDYLNGFLATCAFVDEISESISISRGENSTEFSKEISIKFSNSVLLSGSDNEAVRHAQIFAREIFKYDETSGYDTIPDLESELNIRDALKSGLRKTSQETIDARSNSCSFTQSLSVQNVKESPVRYSHSSTQTISIAETGIVTVSEEGTIEALEGFYSNQLSIAEAAFVNEVGEARVRLQNIFDEYYDCGTDLNKNGSNEIVFISQSKTINPFEGTINYSISANNDPKYAEIDQNVFYSYTISYQKEGDIWVGTENGTIEGLGSEVYNGSGEMLDKFPKHKTAYNFYKNITKTVIRNRIESFLQGSGMTDPLSPEIINRSEGHQLLGGVVSYTRVYSSSPKYADNSNWKSIEEKSVSSKYKFKKKNDFLIVNKPFLVQETAGTTQGSQSISIGILDYRVDPSLGLSTLNAIRAKAFALANGIRDPNIDYTLNLSSQYSYLNDVKYSLSAEIAVDLEAS